MKNKKSTFRKAVCGISLTNIIVAIFALTLSFSMQAFADDATDAKPKKINGFITVLDPQKEKPCITDQDRLDGWIITFIEEPLSLKEDNTSPKLQSRLCYRNTFRYIANGEEQITPVLSRNGCSTKAEEFAKDPSLAQYHISYSCQTIMAILSKGGADFIIGYIGFIYRWAAGLVGLIAVAVIIISSVQISFSGGEADQVNKAKARIIKSLSGIAVLFLAGLILYTINPTFFTK